MKIKFFKLILPAIIIATVFVACLKETYDMNKISLKTDLDYGINLPVLARGVIMLGDLLKTNDTIKELSDNSIMLQIEMDTLYHMVISDVIEISDEDIGEGVQSNYGLDDFTLSDIVFRRSVSLSDMAVNLNQTSEINASNGTTDFPSIPSQDGGSYPSYLSDKFEYMDFSQGTISFTIENHLTATISSITVNVNDNPSTAGNSYSQDFTFTNIGPGTSVNSSLSVAGRDMYNPLGFDIINIQINSQTTSTIDINADSLIFTAHISNIELSRGTAEINRPAPKDSTENQVIAVEGKDDIKLTKLTLSQGNINYNINNDMGENIIVKLIFPETDNLDGSDFIADSITVLPKETKTGSVSLANTVTDLTLSDLTNNTFNTFPIRYIVRVDSTKRYIPFTTTDSVRYTIDFSGVEYSLIEGYFGRDTNSQASSTNLGTGSGFSGFEGEIKMNDPKLKITYFNSIGVPNEIDLKITAIINNNLEEAGGVKPLPSPDFPGDSKTGEITFDKSNDLDKIFVFPMPNDINYNVDAYTNYNGETFDNFATPDGELYIGMNLEVPFDFSSEGFVFKDTMALNIPAVISADYAGLLFRMKNEMPFNIIIKAFAWDSAGNHLETDPVLSDTLMKAPEIDNTGFVDLETVKEEIREIGLESDDFDKIMSSDHLIIHASIDTKDAKDDVQSVKLKTTYKVDFKLGFKGQLHIGRINIPQNNKEDN